MDILDYNKRCAEFLGIKSELRTVHTSPYPDVDKPIQKLVFEIGMDKYSIDRLQFHSNWKWIIRMVEAIEKFVLKHEPEFSVTISNNICKISNATDEIAWERAGTKQEAVVNAIYKFLQLYKTK